MLKGVQAPRLATKDKLLEDMACLVARKIADFPVENLSWANKKVKTVNGTAAAAAARQRITGSVNCSHLPVSKFGVCTLTPFSRQDW